MATSPGPEGLGARCIAVIKIWLVLEAPSDRIGEPSLYIASFFPSH